MTKHDITKLEPKLLWKWFNTICSIPHPTFHEKKLVEYVAEWAKSKGIFVAIDKACNVFLKKPATPGYENKPSICLQAHFDMVPQSNNEFDFTTQPIETLIQDGYVIANNTTLGADNGIGLASILAIFESDTLEHGPLEAMLTTEEEVGMGGAHNLGYDMIDSKLMINTDTEVLGSICIGCAGGARVNITNQFEWTDKKIDSKRYTLEVKGLRGGHSGIEINTNKVNAIKLLGEILGLIPYANLSKGKVDKIDYFIYSLNGGTASNAIPRSAVIDFAIEEDQIELFLENFDLVKAEILETYKFAEQKFELILTEHHYNSVEYYLNEQDSARIIKFINLIPNGVIKNSEVVENTVENSLSLGVINLNKKDGFIATSSVRSISDIGIEIVSSKVLALASLCKFAATVDDFYPRWKPQVSKFKDYVFTQYSKHIKKVNYQVIHAGLECGLILEQYPELDIVSFGPNIDFPHSPQERVEIKSVEEYYKILTDILKNVPEKL